MYYRKLLSVILSCILGAGGALAQENKEASRLSREGVEAAKAKNWSKAVESFRKAVEIEPKDAKNSENLDIVLLQRASAYIAAKKFDEAIVDLNDALKLKGNDAPAHRQRAYAYLSKNDWKNALEDYNVVVRDLKNDPEAYDRRAYVELQLKDYDKALADYSEAIKLKPKEARLYQMRGFVLQTKGDLPAALSDVNKALQLDPANTSAQQTKKFLEAKLNAPPTPPPLPNGPIANPHPRPAVSATPAPARTP